MKIVLIVDDYLPDSTKVAAKMMHELALGFKKIGHQVLVITPNSYQVSSNNLNHIFEYEGIRVFRFPSGRLKNVFKFIRLINEMLLPIRALFYGRNLFKSERFDLIVYYSPSIFWGYLIHRLKKKWQSRTYLILRDIFPQWAIDNGIIKDQSLLTIFFKKIEFLNYRAADRIGLMSARNLDWFSEYFKENIKLEVLHNWISVNEVEKFPNLGGSYYRKKLGLENKIIFFYGGNIGKAQDMTQILSLAKNLEKYNDVFFLLVGSGDQVELVKDFITEEKTKNIILLDPVDQMEYKRILKEVDVGLFCLSKSHSTHNFPGKILGYMSEGLPILGSVNLGNDLKDMIEENGAGIVKYSGDQIGLTEGVLKMIDSDLRKKMSKNAIDLVVKEFSVSSAVDKILLD